MAPENIANLIRKFNIETLEIMDKYRDPSKKNKRDKELKSLCENYNYLIECPQTDKKVVDFIKSYTIA